MSTTLYILYISDLLTASILQTQDSRNFVIALLHKTTTKQNDYGTPWYLKQRKENKKKSTTQRDN